MPRRKRTNSSSDPYTYSAFTKRGRQSSSLEIDKNGDSFGSQGKLYKVRDIIKESRTKYLIDWEDDPDTGEKFEPTWEPKSYANAQAVIDWKQKQREKRPKRITHHKTRNQSRSILVGSSPTIETSPPTPQPRRPQIVNSSSPLAKEAQPPQATPNKTLIEIADSQLSLPTPPSLSEGEIVVEISQHSSLDRDQYLVYLASQPSQNQEHCRREPFDSGIGESSPVPQNIGESSPLTYSSPYEDLPEDGSIPESYSVHNSSNYKLSHRDSATSGSEKRSPNRSRITHLDTTLSASARSPILSQSASSDPIEDSEIRHSQTRNIQSAQSQSTLERYSLESTSTSASQVHGFNNQVDRIFLSHNEPEKVKGVETAVESSAVELTDRGTPTAIEAFQQIPLGDAITSAIQNYNHETATWIGTEQGSLDFQTQVPLPFDSQASERTNKTASSVEELWQSAQFPVNREIQGHLDPASTTENPSLNQRAPLPDTLLHPAQIRADIAVASIETSDIAIEEIPSSIPSTLPSQLVEILDPNIQRRLASSYNLEMSGEPYATMGSVLQDVPPRPMSTGSGLREKLKIMRAASAAEVAARRIQREISSATRATKSPSVIPEPPLQETTGDSRLEVRTIDVPLPQRMSQTGPHIPINPSKLHLHKEMSQQPRSHVLEAPKLGRMEYAVSLPLPARVKDQYIQLLDYFKGSIHKFFEEEPDDQRYTVNMKDLIHRLNDVTTHIDLDNASTLTQKDVTPEMQVMWATDSSAKFQFLQYLIDNLRNRECHIAIVAKGPRLLALIEAFLQGLYVGYNRPETETRFVVPNDQDPLRISLLASAGIATRWVWPRNLIIDFDSSFDPAQMQALRRATSSLTQLVPVIHLLVYCSADHISRCIPESMTGLDRLRATIACITEKREDIGKLLPEEASPVAAAEEVAIFVREGGLESQWTLPSMRPVDIGTAIEVLRLPGYALPGYALPGTEIESEPLPSSQNNGGRSDAQKRSMSTFEEDLGSLKRQRMTPVSDLTHIRESITRSSEPATPTVNNLRTALANAQSELQKQAIDYAAREETLKTHTANVEGQLSDQVNALGELQTRFEDITTAYHTLRHDHEDLVTAAAAADRKRDALMADFAVLKEQRQSLGDELRAARDSLATSAIPAVAELERLRSDVRLLTQDKLALEKKVQSITRDFDFTRQQYQLASSAAVAAASRASDLEVENVALQQKASGEAMRLRQTNIVHAMAQQIQENEKLTLEITDLRELIRKKERGRGVTTRTGSVAPKSPRLGTSPAPSRAGSRAPGSRPGSPVRSFLGVRKGRGPID